MSNPLCVCISDIHFTVQNLELCTKALTAAIDKANELKIPLVIAGDLNDTKAVIRAEVANRLILLLQEVNTHAYILVGNHDLINEKGIPHGLNYLSPYASIVSFPLKAPFNPNTYLIPYHSDTEALQAYLKTIPEGSQLIMHQGFHGANTGDYIQDKSAISAEIVKDHKVISGHYHQHQTVGTVTYIGSPFTMTFGEANDGPKGFLILNKDSTFTRNILNLRKHVCINRIIKSLYDAIDANPEDLVWLKVTGSRSELAKIDKKLLGNVKIDLIPTDDPTYIESPKVTSAPELLDSLIDNLSEMPDYKAKLKTLWRDLLETSRN